MRASAPRMLVLGMVATLAFGAAPAIDVATPAPGPAALTEREANALYDAAYDRWRALPIAPYSTYRARLTFELHGRKERVRSMSVAYRRRDNTCLIVGEPLDSHDRPDPTQVTDRCLAPDYAFNFVPQYGGAGAIPLDIATPVPDAPGGERTIGHVVVRSRPYEVTYAGSETIRGIATDHLSLRPLGDARSKVLRDLWIDPATKGVVRLGGVAGFKRGLVSVGFDADYDETATSQSLARVTGDAKAQLLLVRVSAAFEYRLADVAYPAHLPNWYFDRKAFFAHGGTASLSSDRETRTTSGGGTTADAQ